MTTVAPLRIANCSAAYGDRLGAAREMVEGGPIDVLTGDYLAELTMTLLWRKQAAGKEAYATTFLKQMEAVLGLCLDRGIRVVANAGGLDPAGLASELRSLAQRLGLTVSVAHVEGDDVTAQLGGLRGAGHVLTHMDTGQPLAELDRDIVTANAYLGGWGIAEALGAGADVVVCGRVSDASLAVGPAAWHFGWARTDWDRLAGAVVAGHVIECGPQATGGNYSFFSELRDPMNMGFPIAEIAIDGSAVITKHPGTGGEVSVGTVTAQLLYEVGGPGYINPDVVARLDTIALTDLGEDRVRISGVRGEPAPADVKLSMNYLGGFRNDMTYVLTGLDVDTKAELVTRQLLERLGGAEAFESFETQLIHANVAEARTDAEASAHLRVSVKDRDKTKVGRAFSNAAIELALSSYPGLHFTGPPRDAAPYAVHWPALVPAGEVPHVVVLPDGRRIDIAPTTAGSNGSPDIAESRVHPSAPAGPTTTAPLGTLFGARSGDKGGNANVGVWARSKEAFEWLAGYLDEERFRELVPETAELLVQRHVLPNLLALNFVVVGLLGEGVASSTRPDSQAKGLGEFLRSRSVELPSALLTGQDRP